MKKYVDVYMMKEKNRAIEIDAHNYNLGRYLTYAYHNPKKYPKKPFLAEDQKPQVMSGEDMERVARSITNRLKNKHEITRSRSSHHSEHR